MAVTDLPDPISSPAPEAPEADLETPEAAPEAAPDATTTRTRRDPMPLSRALSLFLGLAMVCIALLAVVTVTTASSPTVTPGTVSPVESHPANTPLSPASSTEPVAPDTEQRAASQIPALFPAEPRPVPQELITGIEAASGDPLPVELGRLLGAIQEGFGRESVQLAPELRAYVFRMASRFDWNPDTFRVAVTAPDAELAEARATTLRRLFESATGSERLQIRSGAGPHSLTLVSDS